MVAVRTRRPAKGHPMSVASPLPMALSQEFAQAIVAQGEDHFCAALLGCARANGVAADHCSIFAFDETLRPRHVTTASHSMSEVAHEVAMHYADEMYAQDPMRGHLQAARDACAPLVMRLDLGKMNSPGYHNACILRIGTVDKVSIVTVGKRNRIVLNYYRHVSSGPFSAKELARLQSLAPVHAALATKHESLTRPSETCETPSRDGLSEQIAALGAALSQRELEVCAMILRGHTSESIALNLGVSLSTVLTFRKRAYAKLSISSANELFRRVLQRD